MIHDLRLAPNYGLFPRNPAIAEIPDGDSVESCCGDIAGRDLGSAGRANDGRGAPTGGSSPVASRWRLAQNMARVVGALIVLALTPAPAVSSNDVKQDARSDWGRLETIAAGARTKVRFHEGGAAESVIVKGHFSSFSETSIVLVLKDGVTQSIQKDSVQFVRVRRPFLKRKAGWIVGAGAAALACALASCDADITPSFIPIFTASYAGPIGLLACFLSRTRLVYRSDLSID